MRFFWLFWRD